MKNTVNAKTFTVSLLVAITLSIVNPASAGFIWTGNNNNNWDNNGNWGGSSGYPDNPADDVEFNSSGSHRNVDLRGGNRDVRDMTFSLNGSTDYTFDSSNNGSGTILINGNLDIAASGDAITFYDSSQGNKGVDLAQVLSGTWTNDGAVLTVYSNLYGNTVIDMYGDVTFGHANDFSGNFRIQSGVTTLGSANAFANALVTLNVNNGLNLNGHTNVNLGALQGAGNLNLGGTVLNVGSFANNGNYTGNLTGSAFQGAAFEYSGADEFILEGSVNGLNSVTSQDGLLVFAGNSANLIGDAQLILDGGDVALVLGASVTVNALAGSGNQVALNSQTLTIDASDLTAAKIVSNTDGTVDLADPNSVLIIGDSSAGSPSSTFAGLLKGSGIVQKVGSGAWTLTNTNPFSGLAQIDNGSIVIGNANALQFATVEVNSDNSLNLNGLNANIGALSGSGALELDSLTLTTGLNNSSSTYSGLITGDSNSIFKHNGTGTLILTGGTNATPSSFGTLRSQNADGVVVVDGARIDLTSTRSASTNLPLVVSTGDMTLQNGADVQMNTGSRHVFVKNALLTLTGNGTSLSGRQLDAAYSSGETGSILLEDGASLELDLSLIMGRDGDSDLTVQSGATAIVKHAYLGYTGSGDVLVTDPSSLLTVTDQLYLGGLDASTLGGTGTLTVENGGSVQSPNQTKFWTSTSSITVNGGTLETGRLEEHTGVTGTINISDPSGGVALTVGTNDGSSTFSGTIQDAAGGPGSLTKTGTGTFTLGSANTFTGTTNIDAGSIVIGHVFALQNSTVSINVDDGLDLTTNPSNARLGALSGSGSLNLESQNVTTGVNNNSSTYSGRITGNSDSYIRHAGTGTLTLTGGTDATPSSFGTLRSEDPNGAVIVDGARINLTSTGSSSSTLPLSLNIGKVTLQNGADVQMISGSRWGVVNDNLLTVTGNGTSLSGKRLDAAEFVNTTGSILIEDDASVDITDIMIAGYYGDGDLTIQSEAIATTNRVWIGIIGSGDVLVTDPNSLLTASYELYLGGFDSTHLGGKGMLTIENGGRVKAPQETKFWTSTSSITVNGGTLETDTLAEHTGVTGTIKISDPNNGVALTVGTGDGSSTINGLIQNATGGPGSLTKTGTGTLTLTHANTYSGTTNIDDGSIIVANANALQKSTVAINVDNGLDVTTNQINAMLGGLSGNGALNIGSQILSTGLNNSSTTYAGLITGDSDSRLAYLGNGMLSLTGGTDATPSSFGSLQSVNNNGAIVVDGARIDLTSSGSSISTFPLGVNNGDMTLQNGADVQMNTGSGWGVVNDGLLTMTGNGTSLSGARLDAGYIASAPGSIVLKDGAKLNLSDTLDIGHAGTGHLTVQSGALGVATHILLGVTGSADVLVTGHDSDLTANNDLHLGGADESTLGGTGTITIENGAQVFSIHEAKFWTSTSSITVNGGSLQIDGLVEHTGVMGTINISDIDNGYSALLVGVTGGVSTFNGLIQDAAGGPGSFDCAGTVTLTNANTYSGGTSILGIGTLLANNTSGSATGSGGITIDYGGTLGGTGSAAGLTTVNNGTIAPGLFAGRLTLDDVTFNASSSLDIELGGLAAGITYDQLVVNNTANLGGTLDLTYINTFTATPSQSFVILTAGTLNGAFDTVNYPDDQNWSITYDTQAGTVTVSTPCSDSDGDGVCDVDDNCPDTIPGAPVDVDGCPDPAIPADFDNDGDVDNDDADAFEICFAGPILPFASGCDDKDLDNDLDVDMADFTRFQRCFSGENIPGDPFCAE